MAPRNESAAEVGTGAAQGIDCQKRVHCTADAGAPQQQRHLNPQTKRAAVLRTFLQRGARGLNCFESARIAHDYVLRTTVSEIRRYHGIEFLKRFEKVPNFAGGTTDCVRYALTAEGAIKARDLLGDDLREAA